MEIKAAELIKTTQFPSEYTLRFPRYFSITLQYIFIYFFQRMQSVRYDKNWDECMKVEELLELLNSDNY